MFTYPIYGLGGGATSAVISVEYVEFASVADSGGLITQTANLTKSQDETQCVPFLSQHDNADTPNDADVMGDRLTRIEMYDNAGTPAVRLTQAEADGTTTYGIYVVEFDPTYVNVQQIDFTGSSGTTINIACTAVDLSKTWAVAYARSSGTGALDDWDHIAHKTHFTSTTQLRLTRAVGTSLYAIGTAYIMEDVDGGVWDVASYNVTNTGTSGTFDQTITSVDRTRTFVFGTAHSNRANYYPGVISFWMPNDTTVRCVRHDTSFSTTLDAEVFVVQLADGVGTVQEMAAWTHSWGNTGATVTNDYTITEVGDKAVPFSPTGFMTGVNGALTYVSGSAGGIGNTENAHLKFTSSTNLRATRWDAGGTAGTGSTYFRAYVVDWT